MWLASSWVQGNIFPLQVPFPSVEPGRWTRTQHQVTQTENRKVGKATGLGLDLE